MICSSAPGSRKPLESWPTVMCTATFSSSSVAIDQNASEAVLGKQLRGAFGAALGGGDEQHRVAALAHALDLGDPVLNPAAEFDGGLAGDVQRGSRRARLRRPSPIAN